jgi:NAD(P)-dependent dehydrogenase (short-subunit alcohol dehydrogenase family)
VAGGDGKVVIVNSARTVVVSGGGTGIGRAVAGRLAGSGQHVTVVGRRRAPLDEVAAGSELVDVMPADVSTVPGAESVAAGLRGSGGGPYGAMKAALHAWAFDLASELGSHQGTANVIAPGFVPDTEFWAGRLTDDMLARRSGQTMVGRPGTPDEVASLVEWLLGADGGWVTGQVLSPNGGVVLGR